MYRTDNKQKQLSFRSTAVIHQSIGDTEIPSLIKIFVSNYVLQICVYSLFLP